MIPAKNYNEILNEIAKKHSFNEEFLIGIMIAKYSTDSVSKVVDQFYNYWDKISKKYVNFYWIGYGKYCPYEKNDNFYILKLNQNRKRIYYDEEKYIESKKQLEEIVGKKLSGFNLLIFQCRGQKINNSPMIKINLSKLYESKLEDIEEYVEWIIEQAKHTTDIYELIKKYRRMDLFKKIKKIDYQKIVNIFNTAITIISLSKG